MAVVNQQSEKQHKSLRSPSSPVEGSSSRRAVPATAASSSGSGQTAELRRWESARHKLEERDSAQSTSRGRKHSASPKAHYKHSYSRMPKYKIKYLNLRARAEPIRLLFNYVQHPFEDSRENFLEFTKYKDKLPLTHLPKLVVDGQLELSYTSVILAYLGEKFGLEAETAEEKAVCAQLAQRINIHFDYIKPFVNCLLGLIPAEKLPALADQCFLPCITEDFGPVFERQLEVNNTGYLVGDKLTWIDFYTAAFADLALSYGRHDILDRFPRVLHHCRAVHSLPQLQQHIKTRPDTIF